jgi:hypothetical protein
VLGVLGMDIVKYFESLNDELNSLKNRVRVVIEDQHWLTDGTWRESVLKSMLRRQLPSTVLVGSGFLLCPGGRISTQQDIILYEANAPIFFRDSDTVILESKYVMCTIEVKSKPSLSKLGEVIEKVSKNIKLFRHYGLINTIFLYETDFNTKKIDLIKSTVQFNVAEDSSCQIELICLGSKNLIYWWEKSPPNHPQKILYEYYHHYTFEKNLAVGYFIQNIVEHCTAVVTRGNSNSLEDHWWYPKESKEEQLVNQFSFRQTQPKE